MLVHSTEGELKLVKFCGHEATKEISLGNFDMYQYYHSYDVVFTINKGRLGVCRLDQDRLIEHYNSDIKSLLSIDCDRYEIRYIQPFNNYLCIAVLNELEEKMNDDPEDVINFEQVFYFLKLSIKDDTFIIKALYNSDLVMYYDKVNFGNLRPKYNIIFYEE
jgi:hypothetical protein